MKIKPFGENIKPACKYCVHIDIQKGKCICDRKRSEVPADNHCIWYKYNPLERIPEVSPDLPKYDANDFSVE